jgi:Membrane-bound metallopeptidase
MPSLLLAYHKYIFMARLEQMHHINKALERLEQNKRKIKLQTKELERLESKQQKQKLELEKTKQEYSQALSMLKGKIAIQSKKLKQLLMAKRNLERLIDSLTTHKVVAMSQESKTRACRNFVWPTKGVVVTRFGSSIEQSSWKWNGLVIRAPENQDIYAISPGKIVYADWLAGYGLLLIIDHGNGYMSLYGHNNRFRKKLNASVKAGEVIAAVGKSGSEEHQLYFAIRYNGKPIDPEKWCR